MFRKSNLPAVIGGALSAAFTLISIPNILMATDTSNAGDPQTTKSAFSVTTLLTTLYSGENIQFNPSAEVVGNWNTIKVASYALFILATLIWTVALTRRKSQQPPVIERSNIAWILTLGGGGVLLFPYLLGNSHDYRLIFLIPMTAGAVLLGNSRATIGTLIAVCSGIAAITSAAMVPLPNGFIWNTPALVIGDAALLIALSGITALWLTTAFARERTPQA